MRYEILRAVTKNTTFLWNDVASCGVIGKCQNFILCSLYPEDGGSSR